MEFRQKLRYLSAILPGRPKAMSTGLMLMISAIGTSPSAVAQEADQQIESVIETALILTDTDAISLGLLQFDAGSIPGLEGEEFGSSESVSKRRRVRTFVLPWHWQTGEIEQGASTYIRARLMYFEAEQDILSPDSTSDNGAQQERADTSKSRVYGGYLGGGINYKWSDHWQGSVGAGMHLVRYQNDREYNSVVGPATEADELLFNSSLSALIGQLRARVSYQNTTYELPWRVRSTYTYYAGDTMSSEQAAKSVEPETWSWINGAEVSTDMPPLSGFSNKLRFFAKRVDVGGEVQRTLATDHYYQLGVGWLFKVSQEDAWIDNFGASVSLNIGSALSGGNLSILYNEEW